MGKKANYLNLTNYLLTEIPESQNKVELPYELLENILGSLPSSTIQYGGITIRSKIGGAILKAGFIFTNSYQDEKITLSRNKEKAKELLTANDRSKTVINKRIFLNVIFPNNAGYLSTYGNIGHEIIDIFGADGGKYYYYLNPWGLISKDKIPDVIISICQSSTGLYKILNKAVIKKPDAAALTKSGSKDIFNLYRNQMRQYKYNGKYLEEYFEENAGENSVLISAECKGIYEPKKPIYFAFKAFKKNNDIDGIYRLVSTGQGQTTKFVDFGPSDQAMLEDLVNDNKIWKKTPIKSFKEYAESFEKNTNFSYFSALGIDTQELQYSNAIKLFLINQNLTYDFLKKIGCSVKKNEKWNVEREEYNIDLLFTNFNKFKKPVDKENEKIVIIENKIKANVTPTDNEKTIKEQIEKVFMHVNGIKSKSELTDSQNKEINRLELMLHPDCDKVPSQLSKYYIYAVALARKRKWSKKKITADISCFFLCPNYSKVLYETSKNGSLKNNTFIGDSKVLFLQEKYKLITYDKILSVFEQHLSKISDGKIKYLLEDFILSLKKQAKDRDDSLEQKMIEMFYLRSAK